MNIPKYIELYRKELELKNYSQNTIKNYVFQVCFFLKNHEKHFTEPSKINESFIKEWVLQFKTRNSMCHSISALKLFYIVERKAHSSPLAWVGCKRPHFCLQS